MRVVAEVLVRVGKRLEDNFKGLYAKADNREKLDISTTKKDCIGSEEGFNR